jgi:hypothetical protein
MPLNVPCPACSSWLSLRKHAANEPIAKRYISMHVYESMTDRGYNRHETKDPKDGRYIARKNYISNA